jgi:hypothetical protein
MHRGTHGSRLPGERELGRPTLYPVKIKGDKSNVILAVVAQALD